MSYIISNDLDFEQIKKGLSGDAIPRMTPDSIYLFGKSTESEGKIEIESQPRKISTEAFLFFAGRGCELAQKGMEDLEKIKTKDEQ